MPASSTRCFAKRSLAVMPPGLAQALGPVLEQIAEMTVCSDMWQPYLKVIREKCSDALHILDRFHIVAKMNKALDEVRAEESGRMKRARQAPVLRKSRSLLLKHHRNLVADQRFPLRDFL